MMKKIQIRKSNPFITKQCVKLSYTVLDQKTTLTKVAHWKHGMAINDSAISV